MILVVVVVVEMMMVVKMMTMTMVMAATKSDGDDGDCNDGGGVCLWAHSFFVCVTNMHGEHRDERACDAPCSLDVVVELVSELKCVHSRRFVLCHCCGVVEQTKYHAHVHWCRFVSASPTRVEIERYAQPLQVDHRQQSQSAIQSH